MTAAREEPVLEVRKAIAGSRSGRREAQADDFMAVRELLAAGNGYDAAKLLLDVLADPAKPMPDYWVRLLGEKLLTRLISAYAHFPCFACEGGLESCDACGATGFAAEAKPCAACVGFGSKRCDFCNASGLAAYGLIPLELRTLVLAARVGMAKKHLVRFLERPRSGKSVAEEVRHLQEVNMLLGVLENAIVAAKELEEQGLLPGGAVPKLTRACGQATNAAGARIRDVLRVLAALHRRSAMSLVAIESENAEALADTYEAWAESASLEGTGVFHPFLPGTA